MIAKFTFRDLQQVPTNKCMVSVNYEIALFGKILKINKVNCPLTLQMLHLCEDVKETRKSTPVKLILPCWMPTREDKKLTVTKVHKYDGQSQE